MTSSSQPDDSTTTPDGDAESSAAGSSFENAETATGGADAVPDDPDVNTRQAGGSLPGGGDGPGAGLSAPENNNS